MAQSNSEDLLRGALRPVRRRLAEVVAAAYRAGVALAPAVQGARFRDLPDPFAPLVAIWQLGYAVVDLRDDAVVLAAPWPALP